MEYDQLSSFSLVIMVTRVYNVINVRDEPHLND